MFCGLPMEGQQGAVAEGAHELEVLCPCFGVAFSDPTDLAIVAADGTIREPSGEIRNISVDGYRHTFIIQPLPGVRLADVRSSLALRHRGRVRKTPPE